MMFGDLCGLRRGRGMIAALGISFATCIVATAGRCDSLIPTDASPEQLAEQYVDEQIKLFRTEANLDLANQVLSSDSAAVTPASASANGSGQELPDVNDLLLKSLDGLNERIDKLHSKEIESDGRNLRDVWIKLRKQRNRLDLNKAAIASDQPADIWLALVGHDSWSFWFSGTLAIGVLAFVSWHDRRHEYRRALNGSTARAYGLTRVLKWTLCLLVVVLLTAVFAGKHITRFFGRGAAGDAFRTTEDMTEEITKTQGRRTDAETKLKEATDKLDAKRKELLAEATGSLQPPWERLLADAPKLKAEVKAATLAIPEVDKEANEVVDLKKFIAQRESKVDSLNRWKWAIDGGVGIMLSAVTVLLGFALLVSIRRRENRTKHTCPMCLGYNTLAPESSPGGDGINDDVMLLRCNGHINAPSGETECPFTFEPFYQTMDKLCFPTLGIPQAGKTHWLAMVYRELNAGRFDNDVQFEKVETERSKEFDQLVRQIINLRMNPAATVAADLPHPLILNFCDNDSWGKSNLLVNIFDYSGEITSGDLATRTNAYRRRALHADGYFFFLDPTEARDKQEEALNRFRRDLRVLGNVRASRSLQTPVALCISKIDLLCQHVPDPSFLRHFYNELQRIDPSGQSVSRKIIEERSELARELRDVIWPNWNIERLINDLFGGRYMFFPLSPKTLGSPDPTSLQGAGDPATDPFGILEPLVWLLHMNGYPVLKKE
jgi:hypothetical protein